MCVCVCEREREREREREGGGGQAVERDNQKHLCGPILIVRRVSDELP